MSEKMRAAQPETESELNILGKLRKNAGLNITEAAARFGVDRGTLSKWEKNRVKPHASRRNAFLAYLKEVYKLNDSETRAAWKELMAYVWQWDDVADEELSKYKDQEERQNINKRSDYNKNQGEETTPFLFRFGPYEIPYHVLDGDGEVAYLPERITCYYEDKPLRLPEEIAKIKAEIAETEAAKGKDDPTFKWNGPQYYLAGWVRSRTEIEEFPVLKLWFGPSDYYTYMATSMSLHNRTVFDPRTGTQKTLYEKYFSGSGYDWSSRFLKPYPLFSTVFGLVLALLTSDNQMIIVQRPKGIGGRAGILNIAINESLHPIKDKVDQLHDPAAFGTPDLYKTAARAGKEELNLHTSKVTFLAFGVDTEYSMWNMLGYATTHLTAEEVKNKHIFGSDKWEGHGLHSVSCKDIQSIIEFVDSRIKRAKAYYATDVWSPGALAAVYLTLVHKFGKREVEAAVDKYFKK